MRRWVAADEVAMACYSAGGAVWEEAYAISQTAWEVAGHPWTGNVGRPAAAGPRYLLAAGRNLAAAVGIEEDERILAGRVRVY